MGQRFFSFYTEDELVRLVENSGFRVGFTQVLPDAVLTGKCADPEKSAWICLYGVSAK